MIDKKAIPEAFKIQLGKAVEAYMGMKDKLVNDDTNILEEVGSFEEALNNVDMTLVLEDAHVAWIRSYNSMEQDLELLIKKTKGLDEQRAIFSRINVALMKAVSDGKYTFVAWHENFGETDFEVEIAGGEASSEVTLSGN